MAWLHRWEDAHFSREPIIVEINPDTKIIMLGPQPAFYWNDPEGYALGVAFVQFDQPIYPLLDWCLEHAHLAGYAVESKWTYRSSDQEIEVRQKLEKIISDFSSPS